MPSSLPRQATEFVGLQSSPETRRAYARDLRIFYDFCGANDISTTYLDIVGLTSFRDYLVEEFAPNGAARVWSAVRSFLKYTGAGTSEIDRVKAPQRVKNTTPRVPSDADVDALINAASDNPHHSLVIALLLNGLRASEVANLKNTDLEHHGDDDKTLALVLKVTGKGMKQRLVPATIETEKALTRFRARFYHVAGRTDWVVPNMSTYKNMNYRQIEHIIYQYGIAGMHPHALRHHYATRLIRAGVSVLHVQKLLGHTDVSTTERYVTLDLGDLVEAASKDPMNQPKPLTVVEERSIDLDQHRINLGTIAEPVVLQAATLDLITNRWRVVQA